MTTLSAALTDAPGHHAVFTAAVPVLGRFGARADNPTLLDRDYLVGWLLFAGMVGVVTAAWILLQGRRRARRISED